MQGEKGSNKTALPQSTSHFSKNERWCKLVQCPTNEIKTLFNASENNDYLDNLIQYFDSSDFPIQLKYKQCLPIIIREQLDYFREL